jgi:succinoglycan biosynthesis transport protein ExoP
VNPNEPTAVDFADQPGTILIARWRTVRKYWATTVATALAIALGVTFYTLGQTKIYQATATVQFDPTPPRPLGKDVETVVDMGAGNYWNNREYYETQYKIIQSMRVALAVVQALDLNHDASFCEGLAPGVKAKGLPPLTPEEAADRIRAHLTVDAVKESRLAIVRYEDADPSRAQRILSTLVDTYVEQNLDDALESTSSAVDWLRGQLDKLKTDLSASEMALHDYKLKNNILSVAFDDQSNMLREEIKQVNDTLTGVRTKREEVFARRNELLRIKADDPTNLPASELLQSVLLQQLRERYVETVRERDALIGEGKGTNHPDVLAADARVSATRAALLAEVRNIQGAVDRDLTILTHQEAGLASLYDKAKKQALDLNLLEIEYNRLRRAKDNNEKLYELILERTKESDLTRMMRVNNIRVIDKPLLPRAPVRPRVAVNVALGIIFGAGLGIAAAIGRGLLDRTVKTPDDVQRELGLTFLGLLPELDEKSTRQSYYARRRTRRAVPEPSGNPELIVHELPGSGLAEASRAIRTNLTFMAPDHPYRTLLITSAGPAEGKTTVACCIAIAMAQAGHRVVLVDCDLRRPRIHRVFRKNLESGVTTALLDDSTLEIQDLSTEVPNLSVIASGPIPPNPAELLHSERFRSLVRKLSQRFDRVILDSPPVVAVTDAAVLSTLVDATVLVVRAFATRKEYARHGARALTDVGGKLAGVVLNAVDLDRHEYQHYYYYYKRDEYYGPTPAEPGALSGSPGASPPSPT